MLEVGEKWQDGVEIEGEAADKRWNELLVRCRALEAKYGLEVWGGNPPGRESWPAEYREAVDECEIAGEIACSLMRWQAVDDGGSGGGNAITKHPHLGPMAGYHAGTCWDCNGWLADLLNRYEAEIRELKRAAAT